MRKLILIAGAVGATGLVGILGACGSSSGNLGTNVTLDAGADSSSPPKADSGGGNVPVPDAGTPQPPAPTFSVGGSVTGLLGTGLILQNNAGDDVPVAKDGSFTFPTKLKAGSAFAVTIKTQPTAPTQTCAVIGGTGSIANGPITAVTVNCATDKFVVGGSVSGLAGSGLVLQNNAGDDVIVNANGTFAFPTTLSSGAAYAVTVKSQPSDPTQTCTVGTGAGTVAAGNVTNVAVTCVTNEYKVGGTVTGLVGSGLTLQVNGGQSLPVSADGSFQFPTALASGTTYEVTISAQPGSPQQTCAVSGGTGSLGSADVSSVLVNCATNKYAVGGTVSGGVGSGLVLQNNGGNDLTISADGTFAFSTPIENGQPYAVTIVSQPTNPWQTCSVANASGTVGTASVTDIAVTCTTNVYKVKGNVSGLAGSGLSLQNNAGDDLPIAADGSFEFALPVTSGATFNVTVKNQPSDLSQTCTVGNGTGTIAGTDIGNVAITCATNSFTVGGTVSGVAGSGLVVQNNAGDNVSIGADGVFTFPTSILSGGTYGVTILSQPTNPYQTCTVSAGSGTVTNGNVVSVAINCSTNKYVVGGTTSGLAGTGLVLQNNGADDLTLNNNGPFGFGTAIASGATYNVTVKTQPTVPSQTCVVNNGSGTVGGGDISNITVTCTTNKYTIGGTVSGLTSGTVVLQDNGADNLSISANGTFTFATSINSGATYAVTRLTNPAGQACAVTNGSGTVAASNVTNVAVACVPSGSSTFNYTGSNQTFTVPLGVTSITINASGAQGGTAVNSQNCGTGRGGQGGSASGTLTVTPGEVLTIVVGQAGAAGSTATFGGGGVSCADPNTCSTGGGASDVRKGGSALANRVLVAGGGGGTEYRCKALRAGDGGGLVGLDGVNGDSATAGGRGATQAGGGAGGTGGGWQPGLPGVLGVGGAASPSGLHSGSGGGGYYGGGGGAPDGDGGGGSSYIGGVTSGTTTSGLRTGNGTVIISW